MRPPSSSSRTSDSGEFAIPSLTSFHDFTGRPLMATIREPTGMSRRASPPGGTISSITRPTVVVGSIWRPFLAARKVNDEPGEQRVHGDAGQDHDHPLPDRLGLEHAIRGHRRIDVPALQRASWSTSSSRLAIFT